MLHTLKVTSEEIPVLSVRNFDSHICMVLTSTFGLYARCPYHQLEWLTGVQEFRSVFDCGQSQKAVGELAAVSVGVWVDFHWILTDNSLGSYLETHCSACFCDTWRVMSIFTVRRMRQPPILCHYVCRFLKIHLDVFVLMHFVSSMVCLVLFFFMCM